MVYVSTCDAELLMSMRINVVHVIFYIFIRKRIKTERERKKTTETEMQ